MFGRRRLGHYNICFPADFQLGFEHSTYEIREKDGLVNNVVYIVKMNENILQNDYPLTIDVVHNRGSNTAILSKLWCTLQY